MSTIINLFQNVLGTIVVILVFLGPPALIALPIFFLYKKSKKEKLHKLKLIEEQNELLKEQNKLLAEREQ